MRILVCGGRDFKDAAWMNEVLYPRRVSMIIHGAARGADTLAGQWARRFNVPERYFPADWGLHGKAAGPIRNSAMLREGLPDIVIAFPGGRGTADMVRQAQRARVAVLDLRDWGLL
jgi:hypothetical protein